MRRSGLCCAKITTIAIVPIVLTLIMWKFSQDPVRHKHSHFKKLFRDIRALNEGGLFPHDETVSWEDEVVYKADMLRKGPGEQGKPLKLNLSDTEKEKAYGIYRYNTLTSMQISLNRSLPDIRDPRCRKIKYLRRLTPVSIIIPFHNEHWSILFRTCYAILNRSPPELIHEILLVDDASTDELLRDKLDEFISKHIPKTRVLRLKERSGLIIARLAGARVATSEIFIFLDAHVETSYNWLPPLIEPIELNPKTCVCPQVDIVNYETFEYYAWDNGARGIFNWQMGYARLPLLEGDRKSYPKPFKSPIMIGGLFAIRKDFFWELGGYDEGLDIWGGEQYELSFKIWMCGGQMVDAPCSRVGHVFPAPGKGMANPRDRDYLHRNFKRVAEVWMDEYKEFVYLRDPKLFAAIDAGNLTKQKELREKLQCKSFKWFMETIAFDLPKYFPFRGPPDFASGIIRSDDSHNLCLDAFGFSPKQPIGLFECAVDPEWPQYPQRWSLTIANELRMKYFDDCADVLRKGRNARVFLRHCHGQGGNQKWRYDLKRKWLRHDIGRKCLEADLLNRTVYVNICNSRNRRMRWTFGVVNETAFRAIEERKIPATIVPQLKPPR